MLKNRNKHEKVNLKMSGLSRATIRLVCYSPRIIACPIREPTKYYLRIVPQVLLMPRYTRRRLYQSDSSNRLGGAVNSRRTREWHYVKVGRSVRREIHGIVTRKINTMNWIPFYSVITILFTLPHIVMCQFSNAVDRQKIGEKRLKVKSSSNLDGVLIHKAIICIIFFSILLKLFLSNTYIF